MAARKKSWTVMWIDTKGDKPVLDHEVIADRASLEIRIIALTSTHAEYCVIDGDIVTVTVDTSPRISFGAPKPMAPKKPRAKRRTKAEIEAAKEHARAVVAAAEKLGATS